MEFAKQVNEPLVVSTPSRIVILGNSGAGKTYLSYLLLKYQNENFSLPFTKILSLYMVKQPLYDTMKAKIKNITFVEGIQKHFVEDKEYWPQGGNYCLVIDDQQLSSVNSEVIYRLLTVFSHHRNIIVVCLWQNYFLKGTKFGTAISRQFNHAFLLPSKGDLGSVTTLGAQILPGRTKTLVEIYENAIAERP